MRISVRIGFIAIIRSVLLVLVSVPGSQEKLQQAQQQQQQQQQQHQIAAMSSINHNNCLYQHHQCDRSENNCQLDIIILKKVCGDYLSDVSVFDRCNRNNEESCRGAIKTMKRKPGFRNCHCNNAYFRSDRQYHLCRRIWRVLNEHPCSVQQQQRVASVPIPKATTAAPIVGELYNELDKTGLRVVLGGLGMFAEPESGVGGGNSGGSGNGGGGGDGSSSNNGGSSNGRRRSGSSSSSSSSCIAKQEMCHQNSDCYSAFGNFDQHCRFHNCDKNGDQCVTSYQFLRQYGMFDCSCVYHHQRTALNMKVCLKIQSKLRDNKCLAFLNNRVMYQTLSFSTNANRAESTNTLTEIMPKDLQGLKIKSPHCLSSYQLCIQSPQCLQRYLEMEKKCNCSSYSYGECLRAVRSFYSRPDMVTLNAIRCKCGDDADIYDNSAATTGTDNDDDDGGGGGVNNSGVNNNLLRKTEYSSYLRSISQNEFGCQRQKKILQPQCARVQYDGSKVINCLHLMLQCLNDTACLDSFTVFSQLCGPVHRDPRKYCPGYYFRCLDAYRTVWGTIITTQCSCDYQDTLNFASRKYAWSYDPIPSCHFFQRILKEPTCPLPGQEKERTKSKLETPKSKPYPNNDPCTMILKHKLPPDGYVRLNAPSGDNSNNNNYKFQCPFVCRCREKCFQLPCDNIGSNNNDGVVVGNGDGSNSNDNSNINNPMGSNIQPPISYSYWNQSIVRVTRDACILFNMARCNCNSVSGTMSCPERGKINFPSEYTDYKSSDYKLIVQYNKAELVMIRAGNLIKNVDVITRNLNFLMVGTTGFKNCHLSMHGARDSYFTFLLKINTRKENRNNGGNGPENGQFEKRRSYLGFYELSETKRLEHLKTECVMSVKLLQIMINQRYGDVVHNLPLSVLRQADIIVPKKWDLRQDQQHQQQQQQQQQQALPSQRPSQIGPNHSSSNHSSQKIASFPILIYFLLMVVWWLITVQIYRCCFQFHIIIIIETITFVLLNQLVIYFLQLLLLLLFPSVSFLYLFISSCSSSFFLSSLLLFSFFLSFLLYYSSTSSSFFFSASYD